MKIQMKKVYKIGAISLLAISVLFGSVFPKSTSAAASNLIQNPSVETVSGVSSVPAQWQKISLSANQAVYTYPSAAYEGVKALRVDTKRTVAGAGWYFNPVAVTPGATYTFSDFYQSNVESRLLVRYTNLNGRMTTVVLKSLPVSSVWTQATATIVPPSKTVSLTVLHVITKKGFLVTDSYALTLPDTIPPAPPTDTTAPVVSIEAPTAGQTFTGTMSLSATAKDDSPLASFSLFLDDVSIGVYSTTSPISVTLDTHTISDGSHIVSAVAKDLFGNQATSSAITFFVENNVIPGGGTGSGSGSGSGSGTGSGGTTTPNNLIANPSLEATSTTGDPTHWQKGGWGTNTTAFTYPVSGSNGIAAAKITVSNYTDGDAKWYFDDVPVTANEMYSFGDDYQSDATTTLLARFTMVDNTFLYSQTVTLPPSNGAWAHISHDFLTPPDATSVTIFHILGSAGNLTVDNYSLVALQLATNLFSQAMVSLSFDDGWTSQYDYAFPLLSAANMKGSFYIITGVSGSATTPNLIANGGLETAGTNGPAGWTSGSWGSNDATFVYPITGAEGTLGAKVSMTTYTDGDGKWYFDDVTVDPSTKYRFIDSYVSSAASTVTIRYTLIDNSFAYTDLGTLLPSATWKNVEYVFTTPANVKTMTVFHRLAAVGDLTLDNVSLSKVIDYMTPAQIRALDSAGNEIGSHTQTHPFLAALSQSAADAEIIGSKNDLLAMGVSAVNSIAYPNGSHSPSVETSVQNAGYSAGRSSDTGFNFTTANPFALQAQAVTASTTVTDIQKWIDTAVRNKLWLVLMFHQVDSSGLQYATTPTTLAQTISYLQSNNVLVKTVRDGAALLSH